LKIIRTSLKKECGELQKRARVINQEAKKIPVVMIKRWKMFQVWLRTCLGPRCPPTPLIGGGAPAAPEHKP